MLKKPLPLFRAFLDKSTKVAYFFALLYVGDRTRMPEAPKKNRYQSPNPASNNILCVKMNFGVNQNVLPQKGSSNHVRNTYTFWNGFTIFEKKNTL